VEKEDDTWKGVGFTAMSSILARATRESKANNVAKRCYVIVLVLFSPLRGVFFGQLGRKRHLADVCSGQSL